MTPAQLQLYKALNDYCQEYSVHYIGVTLLGWEDTQVYRYLRQLAWLKVLRVRKLPNRRLKVYVENI
jgi:hypothetical protein